jgi:WD40 repeat protein
MYAINDAHRDAVTAIACTSDCRRIVSGGAAGQVRIWAIGQNTQKMVASMKEHKGRVNSVQINSDDTECVSASADGSCIVWSLERFVRNSCLFASTQFKAILYHPDQSQLLTTGSDRKLTYWDVVDGNPIRIVDGSQTDPINCLAITDDGEKFICGGDEKLVMVWGYDEGFCYNVGVGHSGSVMSTAISPDQKTIVTVGDEGAVFLWNMPDIKFGNQE